MSQDGLDWGGEEIQSAKARMSNWYKCNLGYVDIIRVISPCHMVWKHTFKDKGKFCTSMCSFDTSKTCPYCDRAGSLADHKRSMTFALTLLHLTRQARGGTAPRFVGRALAWRFGDERKQELLDIHDVTKGRGGLTKVDLRVAVKGADAEAEKFQKLSIQAMDTSVIATFSEEQKKRVGLEAQDANKLAEIKRLYYPTAEDLMKYLKDDSEAEEFIGAASEEPAGGGGSPFDAGGDPLAGLV